MSKVPLYEDEKFSLTIGSLCIDFENYNRVCGEALNHKGLKYHAYYVSIS